MRRKFFYKNLEHLSRILCLITFCCVFTTTIQAQETVEEQVTKRVQDASDHNYLSFSFENDIIGSGQDENYTNGVRITYFDIETNVPPILDELADAIPTFDLNPTTSTFFNFGQNLYTPSNIRIRQNQQNDRPWAAWAYGSVGLVSLTKNHLDELEFTLGIVGPEALGEQTQKFVHRHISHSDIPKGWNNQLKFEPGAILSWRRRWPIWKRYQFDDFLIRMEPDINLSLGNIYSYAGSGLSISLSPLTSRLQDTPPRVRPAMAGTGFFDTPDQKFSWQVFAGTDMRLIGRNIFLDGNTFKDSHNVDKKYFVGDANIGFAVGFDDYRLSYTLNYRTKEFQGQKDPSLFGSVTLTTRF